MGSREKHLHNVNISKKIDEKLNNYAPFVRNMQIMYSDYKFVVVFQIIKNINGS